MLLYKREETPFIKFKPLLAEDLQPLQMISQWIKDRVNICPLKKLDIPLIKATYTHFWLFVLRIKAFSSIQGIKYNRIEFVILYLNSIVQES